MKPFPNKLEIHNGKTATLNSTLIFLKFKDEIDSKSHDSFLQKSLLQKKAAGGADKLKYNAGSSHFFCSSKKEISFKEVEKLSVSTKDLGLEFFAPVYKLVEKDPYTWFAVKPFAFIATLKNPGSIAEASKLLLKYKCRINDFKTNYLNGQIYVDILPASGYTVFELKQILLKDKNSKFEEINFELIPFISPTCNIIPNDTLYANQWNLEKIDWHVDYLRCTEQAVIAIIDEGCDLAHPDLNFASTGLNLSTMLPPGSPTGNHGTACAGIAAGVVNNAIGVAGVAGKAKLLPLAVQTWSDVEIANGINYATKFGADVISMSFGVYDNWGFWNYNVINPAIVHAHKQGVFLCAATGNENSGTNNRYPAKHPLVVAVGGSNKDDKRKNVGDIIEGFWGACYGLEQFQNSWTGVSVVAPCVQIPTTDRLGSLGYSTGDYYNTFNGTSSATPQVAGLAALLKAKFPLVTNVDIKKIIEMSADKIGLYTYAYDIRFQNASWTQQVGHGRINVRKALILAKQFFSNCHSNCESSCCC